MKHIFIGLAALLAPVLYAQSEIPFDSVPNFLKLPADLHLGEAAGVAVNSKGHIFVFSRGNSTWTRLRRHRFAIARVRS